MQENTKNNVTYSISSVENFTFRSHRIRDHILYFSVDITAEKFFDNGWHFNSTVHADIHYIVHIENDILLLYNDAPYTHVVNKNIVNSEMTLECNNDYRWSFKKFVQIPTKFQSFGVGRTVLNLLLKKAIDINPNISLSGKLAPGDEKEHFIRDMFYKNIGFQYEGESFKIERICDLETFDTLKNIEEIDLKEQFFELHKANEALTKSLVSSNDEIAKNKIYQKNLTEKFDRCSRYRFYGILVAFMLVVVFKIS